MRLSVSHTPINSSGIGSKLSDFFVFGPFPSVSFGLKNILRLFQKVLRTTVRVDLRSVFSVSFVSNQRIRRKWTEKEPNP